MFKRLFQISIIVSLLVHIFAGTGLWLAHKPKPLNLHYIEVDLGTPVDPVKQSEDKKKEQIVQQEKQVNDQLDENAKFLSQFNQKVEKQTRAKETGDFRNAPGPHVDSKQQPADSGQQKKSRVAKTELLPKMKLDNGLPTVEALKPTFDWDKFGNNNRAPGASGSQADDYLKDVKTGENTMLSTREFLYYSYYTRIKNQLKQYWEPKLKERVTKLFQRGRRIASTNTDRITKVVIVLNNKGNLVKVQIVGESGIQDLDEAAADAFRAAAPFPNPPKGIVEEDGMIRIRWDFVIEAASINFPKVQPRRTAQR